MSVSRDGSAMVSSTALHNTWSTAREQSSLSATLATGVTLRRTHVRSAGMKFPKSPLKMTSVSSVSRAITESVTGSNEHAPHCT